MIRHVKRLRAVPRAPTSGRAQLLCTRAQDLARDADAPDATAEAEREDVRTRRRGAHKPAVKRLNSR